jgi:predicted small secreted protein
MNDIKRKLFLAVLLAVSVVSLSACNTVSGAGKDVQKAGEVIEDTAEDAKN